MNEKAQQIEVLMEELREEVSKSISVLSDIGLLPEEVELWNVNRSCWGSEYSTGWAISTNQNGECVIGRGKTISEALRDLVERSK